MSLHDQRSYGAHAAFSAVERGVWVVRLSGEHDTASAAGVTSLLELLATRGYDIVVDLSAVSFMDASTVRALVSGWGTSVARNRSFRLRSPSPPALRLLAICELDQLIEGPENRLVATGDRRAG